MDKGKVLLYSLGAGLIMMAFLDFNMPIYVSLGITVFVFILTLHDFTQAYKIERIDQIFLEKTTLDKLLNITSKSMYFVFLLVSTFIKLTYVLSIPIAIYFSYYTLNRYTSDELNEMQQALTLYTLGLVILIVAIDKTQKA